MPRATPLPPDERRAALIAATEPLLEQFGREVSTKRIAEAAGVAEGTIFRVFPTKEALIDAVCDQVLDLDRTCTELERIDRTADLESRLVIAVAVLQRRLRRIFTLFHALRMERRPSCEAGGHPARHQLENERLTGVLAELLEPDQATLRMPAAEAADALRLVTLALTHPLLSDHRPQEPRQIVDLILHGISRPASTTPSTGPTAC